LTDTDKQNSTGIYTQYKSEKVNNLKYSKTTKTHKKPTKQNYPGSVASYNTRPGNEVGLFYNAPEPTRGRDEVCRYLKVCSQQMN